MILTLKQASICLSNVYFSSAAISWLGRIVLVYALFVGNTIQADVLPPNALIGGQTQLHWAESWFDWAFDFPAASNPILDLDGSQGFQGDIGSLFYLAGTASGEPVVRDVMVPSDKVLFLPLLNFAIDNTNLVAEPPYNSTPQEMADILAKFMDPSNITLFATVDGVPILDLILHHQISDPNAPFSYTVTTSDNFISHFGFDPTLGTGVYPATVAPVMQNSYFIGIEPFAPGSSHEIHFGGTITSLDFSQDNTYHIHVVPEPMVGAWLLAVLAGAWRSVR